MIPFVDLGRQYSVIREEILAVTDTVLQSGQLIIKTLNINAARCNFGCNSQVDVREGFEAYYQWLFKSPYWKI